MPSLPVPNPVTIGQPSTAAADRAIDKLATSKPSGSAIPVMPAPKPR